MYEYQPVDFSNHENSSNEFTKLTDENRQFGWCTVKSYILESYHLIKLGKMLDTLLKLEN